MEQIGKTPRGRTRGRGYIIEYNRIWLQWPPIMLILKLFIMYLTGYGLRAEWGTNGLTLDLYG